MKQQEPFPTRQKRRMAGKIRRRSKAFKIALAIPLISIAIMLTGLSYILGTTMSTWKDLDLNKLENIQQSSFIYDYQDNKILNIHGTENRIKIPLSEIPQHVQDAFIATEDIRFYTHPGFDIRRLISSVFHNLKARAYVQGGGTITQQVVRNGFLTQKKTITRKVQEIYLAYQLEGKYSKSEILETYLNLIYFGKGAYGVETAANRYFGKSVKDISIAEGAMLAGIIKNPSRYSPLINKENSMQRKNLVLDLMVKNNYLSLEDSNVAKEETIALVDTPPINYIHSYFMDMVLEEAAEILKVKEENLFTNGYRIFTTLDGGLQSFCEDMFQNLDLFPKSPINNEPCQGALVVLDSKTGEIRSLLGGREDEKPIRKGFNRATQGKRQPGSAIKPLVVYGPAMEDYGYTPVTFIEDAPIKIDDYTPSNYGGKFHGWVTLREALATSINIPAVKILKDIGIDSGLSFAESLGISFSKEDKNLSAALGGLHIGVSPIELARAYSALAHGGKYKDYTTIRRIEDPEGIVVYESNPQGVQVISEETTFILNNILQSSISWDIGTATRLKSLGLSLAAKTGTVQLPNTPEFKGVNGLKDSWITAYNPDYVATIWMGFDETSPENYLPPGAVGGAHPAELAKALFSYLYPEGAATPFEKPLNVVAVELDLKALQEKQQALLASPLTPNDQITLEYFVRNNMPKEETDYWVMPDIPKDFGIVISEDGLPTISFTTPQLFPTYDIYKSNSDGQYIPIHKISPENQGSIQWTDSIVEPGETYSYYVIATHPEIIIDGQPIQSPPTPTITVTIPGNKIDLDDAGNNNNHEDNQEET